MIVHNLSIFAFQLSYIVVPIKGSADNWSIERFDGMAVLIGISWVFSTNRKAVDWRLAGMGLLIQLTLAVCIIKIPFIESAFEAVSAGFVKVIPSPTKARNSFSVRSSPGDREPAYNFVVMVLPTTFLSAPPVYSTI